MRCVSDSVQPAERHRWRGRWQRSRHRTPMGAYARARIIYIMYLCMAVPMIRYRKPSMLMKPVLQDRVLYLCEAKGECWMSAADDRSIRYHLTWLERCEAGQWWKIPASTMTARTGTISCLGKEICDEEMEKTIPRARDTFCAATVATNQYSL